MADVDKTPKKNDDGPNTHDQSTAGTDKDKKPADVNAHPGAPDAHADLHAPANAATHSDGQAVLAQTNPTKATATMVDAGTLPDTKVVDKGDTIKTATDKLPVYDKPLTPEEKYFTDLYQRRFIDPKVLAKITPVPEPKQGESEQDLEKRYQTVLEERAKAISQEMGRMDQSGQTWQEPPKFGPATQAAYKDYIDWVDKKEVPGQILAMQSGGLPFPPGNPIEVPIENGRRISLDDYDSRLASGKLQLDLGFDATKPPTLANAQKLENALDWSNQTRDKLTEANLSRFDDKMAETIKTLGFPEGWQYQPGQDKNAWRVSVAQMIDLATTVGRMANLVDKMHLTDKVGLPPGAKVTTGEHSTNISLDLPDNLHLNDPATAEKVRQLQEWEKTARPKLDDVRDQLQAVAKNPNLALAWGDTTIPKVKDADGHEVSTMVSLDKDGKMIGIVDPTNLKLDQDGKLLGTVDPKKEKPPGETFKEANLLEQRFTARTDPKTGEIVVNQNVQGQEAPWWSYENLVYTNIGKPADLPERRFKPDDLVAINKGSGTEFMMAKDLQAYASTAAVFHYGEKVLTGVMDGAMIATGTIEIGAALKGARLLAASAEAAAAISRQDVMKAAAKGTWDLTLGVTGVTNSAEIQSSSWGRNLASARNAAFLGTIFYGVAANRIPAMKLFGRSGESTEAAEGTNTAGRVNPAETKGESPAEKADRPIVKAEETTAPDSAAPEHPIAKHTAPDGRILATEDDKGLDRFFSYSKTPDGQRVLKRITTVVGDQEIRIDKSPNSEHEWTVHTPHGDAKLQADIKVNDDGSYTVTHITDERADWYNKAYYSEKPTTPIVREARYYPDGRIETKGMDSGYQPPEGSTYRKDARFGEYWTQPDGKQVWVDGENNIWRERSTGIWHSDKGVLMENKEYVKKERTTAVELKEPLDWTRTEKVTENGQEKTVEKLIHSEPGDMKIIDPNGKGFYVVERDVFDRTYDKAPGVENEYMKKPVRARPLTQDIVVESRWGRQEGFAERVVDGKTIPADYLVTGADGESYPVKHDTFLKLYERTPQSELAENKEYVKKERTTAVELTEPLDWTKTEKVTENGEEKTVEKLLHSKPGDMKIMDPNGKGFYVVERDVFDRTYDKDPTAENTYMKKPVRARLLTQDIVVESRWGRQEGFAERVVDGKRIPADYLVTGADGESYPVKHDTFLKLYEPAPTAEKDMSSFSLPKATGPAVHNADGTTTIPHADGDMIFSRGGDSVTITNKTTGITTTYSGSDLHAAGTRFYFPDGAEERIMPGSGLRFHRTPDMPPGEFHGEDGAVLRDVPRAEPSPTADPDKSPTKFSNTLTASVLPGGKDLSLPQFVRVGSAATNEWKVEGRDYIITAHGTEWVEKDGNRYLIDSRNRLWKQAGDTPANDIKPYGYVDGDKAMIDSQNRIWQQFGPTTWTNDNGSLRITEHGQYWNWKDGTADWVDTEGRQWHREADTKPGRWTSTDGATYDEGTWKYTPRTKDDPHVPAVLESIRKAALAQPAVAAADKLVRAGAGSNAPEAQVPGQPGQPQTTVPNAPGAEQNPATPEDLMKGPSAKNIEALAQKLMLYSTYPVVGQQMTDILKQGKDIVGMQLQSMGYQLSQMWAPKNPYAVAHAVQDYDSMHPAARPNVTLPEVQVGKDNTCSWCPPEDQPKVIQDYKDAFVKNLPDTMTGRASRDQIVQLFDKLSHAVSKDGTDAERDALKKQLAGQATFDRWQIEQLDLANRAPLSDAQLHDLLDPDKRAKVTNPTLKEQAEEFAAMKNDNVMAATSMALIILSRTPNQKGEISHAVADIDSYGHDAGYNQQGYPKYVPSRTVHIEVDDALLTRNLQQTVPKMTSDARGIAIGDLMVKTGNMKPQEFGSILQNVLTNPKSSVADKLDALSDAHGPRMAALIGGLIAQQSADDSLKGQAPGVATAARFGATVSDFMSTLTQAASTDNDPKVRAMSAGLLFGLKRFQKDAIGGAQYLDMLSGIRASDVEGKGGDFVADTRKFLLQATVTDPKRSTDRVIDAAESLALLKSKLPEKDGRELQGQIATALAQSLPGSTADQADRIAGLMTAAGMKQLSQTNPDLAEATRKQFISALQLPSRYSPDTEGKLVSLVGKMSGIADGASEATKQQMFTALNNIAQNAPPVYLDLKSAAMEALGGLGSQAAIPDLEKAAVSEKFPALRLSALKALEQLKDPGLDQIISQRLGTAGEGGPRPDAGGTEGDATVLSYLQDLQYRRGGNQTSAAQMADATRALLTFQASINDRYGELKTFDGKAQKDWTNEKFPLLVRANFDKEVVKQSDGKVSIWTGAPTDEGGDAVTAKRQEQFQQLAEAAQGNDQAAMQARKVLYSMVMGNGGTVGAAETIPTFMYVPNGDESGRMQQAYYTEKQQDWSTVAAVALAKTANSGFAGRDYTASLISQALASGIKGQAREELLKAWETLGSTTGGVRAIPESLYQYVRSRAKE